MTVMYELPLLEDKLMGRRNVSILIRRCGTIRHIVEASNRLVILSSPLAFPGFITYAVRINHDTFAELVTWAKRLEIPIQSYHGHQATLDVINRMLGTDFKANREPYTPREGDVVVAIRLKKRLEKPEDITSVKKEEIDLILLQYMEVPNT